MNGRWRGWALRAACVFAVAAQARAVGASDPQLKGFQPDVTEEEWAAAIPILELHGQAPEQVIGPKRVEVRFHDAVRQRVFVTAAVVIRADGTQGVYRVLKFNHAGYAKSVVAMSRSQRFTPAVKQGEAVAVRREMSYEVEATPAW